jgi:hypothetical protein
MTTGIQLGGLFDMSISQEDIDPHSDAWYAAYQSSGGKTDKETFLSTVEIFLDICLPSYLGDSNLSRDESIKLFMKKTGLNKKETFLYFDAIDSVTALS